MAKSVSLGSLLSQTGVIGAVRWTPTSATASVASPPRLLEHVGELTPERAERMMANCEAAGMAVFGIAQLNFTRAPHDRTNVYPVDTVFVRGQYTSILTTINRVAVLLRNEDGYDVSAVADQMILVAGA